jgi:hypothetical protein
MLLAKEGLLQFLFHTLISPMQMFKVHEMGVFEDCFSLGMLSGSQGKGLLSLNL